jgi:hypothetical protein
VELRQLAAYDFLDDRADKTGTARRVVNLIPDAQQQ